MSNMSRKRKRQRVLKRGMPGEARYNRRADRAFISEDFGGSSEKTHWYAEDHLRRTELFIDKTRYKIT